MSMTSHSKTLSPTRPQEMPGRSFACCISFSCRARRTAAPAEGEAVGVAGELLLCEGVPRWGVCAWWEDIVGGIGTEVVREVE